MTSLSATASISRIGETLLDFFYWWRSEMRQWIPPAVLSTAQTSERSQELFLTKGGYALDGAPLQPHSTLGETLLSLDQQEQSASVALVLDKTRYFERAISHQRLPLSLLRRAAELDILTETPFNSADIYILLSTRSLERATYAIVRRDIVDGIKEQLAQSGTEVSSISLGSREDAVIMGLRPADLTLGANRGRSGFIHYALLILALLACLFGAYQIDQKTDAAADSLDTQVSEAEKAAHVARAKYDQYSKRIKQQQLLQNKTANTLEVVRIWEELTRLLPDTAFLTDLVIKPDEMEITGFSEAPASLIGDIEASALFEQAQFTSSVVKIPGFKGDRFVISFKREQG